MGLGVEGASSDHRGVYEGALKCLGMVLRSSGIKGFKLSLMVTVGLLVHWWANRKTLNFWPKPETPLVTGVGIKP